MTKTENSIDQPQSGGDAIGEVSTIRDGSRNRRPYDRGVLRDTQCTVAYFRELNGPFFRPFHDDGQSVLGLNLSHRFVRELYHGNGSRAVAREALNFTLAVFVRAMEAATEEKRVEFENVINAWSVAMDRAISEAVADLVERSQD